MAIVSQINLKYNNNKFTNYVNCLFTACISKKDGPIRWPIVDWRNLKNYSEIFRYLKMYELIDCGDLKYKVHGHGFFSISVIKTVTEGFDGSLLKLN